MSLLETLFRLELAATWRMACVIVVFLGLRLVCRHSVSARSLFVAWVAIALLLLFPVSIPVRWSPFNLLKGLHPTVTGMPAPLGAGSDPRSVGPISTRPPEMPVKREKDSAAEAPHSLFGTAACVWIAGLGILLSVRAWNYGKFSRGIAHAAEGGAVLDSLDPGAASELREHGARILVTDSVGAPALHGILRPTLLFPPGLIEMLSPEEMRLIVSHELSHHMRRDLFAQFVIQSAQAVHWFNPLVWLVGTAARNDCELACDEQVVLGLGSVDPSASGATLLKILRLAGPSPVTPLGVGILESKKQIKRRIQMIVADRPHKNLRTLLGGALLALVAGLGLTRESQAQSPAPTVSPASTLPMDALAITEEAPPGWWKNGENNEAYTVGVDRVTVHDGLPSAYVKSEKAAPGFGGMMQMCLPDKYVGKRIRYSAWVKTKEVKGHGAHLWFRVDGKQKDQMLQFDNMDGRQVFGTANWTRYSIVLDVPADSKALAFGYFLSGQGQVWVSGVSIEEVGLDVASTNMDQSKKPSLPGAPVNLGFAAAPAS